MRYVPLGNGGRRGTGRRMEMEDHRYGVQGFRFTVDHKIRDCTSGVCAG